MIYVTVIILLIVLLTYNVMIKFSLAWSGPEKVVSTSYIPDKVYLPSVERIIEKDDDNFYGLFLNSYDSYLFGKTNKLTEWTEEFENLGYLFREHREINWASGVDYAHLNLLNNGSLLCSALYTEVAQYSFTDSPFIEFLQTNDGVDWSSAISTNNWSHTPFNYWIYTVQGYSVLEQSDGIKILTYYCPSDGDELNLAVWRLNSSYEGIVLVQESNYTYYANDVWGGGDDFAVNNKHVLFSQSDSLGNREGLIVTYENKTWSFSKFLFPYSKGSMKKMIWEEGKLFLVYNIPYGFNPFKGTQTLAHIGEIVPNQNTNTSSIQEIKRIGKCRREYDNLIVVRGIDQKKIILHNDGWFLYEEKFDVSQLLTYSFSTIGLILLAVLPLIIKKFKRKNLEKEDSKINQ